MPNENPLAPAISGGIPVVGGIINSVMQGAQNKKARRFAERMYQRQRADTLSDWALQNEYNHPSAQMSRLREANLNPNLVYGNGADAGGAPLKSPDAPSWKPEHTDSVGNAVSAGLSNYMDMQLRQAQIDATRTANTVALEDVQLRKAQTVATLAGASKTKVDTNSAEFDLAMKSLLKEISVDAAATDLAKQKADLQYTLDNNDRAAAANAATVAEAAERILRSRAERTKIPAEKALIEQQIRNLKKDEEIKSYDIKLLEKGVRPNDNIIIRKAAEVINQLPNIRNTRGAKLTKYGPQPWNVGRSIFEKYYSPKK